MSENRSKQHKFAGKKDVTRDNRRNVAVQLRKTARDEQLSKRRNVIEDGNTSPLKEKSPMKESIRSGMLSKERLSLDEIEKLFKSTSNGDQLRAVNGLRRVLSASESPPINTVIERGLVPVLIEKLKDFSDAKVQFEAAWAITNIASGTSSQTAAVVRAGGIPVLIALFDSPEQETVEQAIWALGNIAGDGEECRDQVLSLGVVGKLMAHIKSEKGDEFLQNLTWMISNLCRNKPTPRIELLKPLLEPLHCLVQWPDTRVQADASWALSYITDGSETHIQAVCDTAGLVPRLVQLAGSNDKASVVPSLRTVGNLITGSDSQTQFVLDQGLIQIIPKLLQSRHANVVKETCWAVSNITAGTAQQAMVVQNANIIPTIIQILKSSEFKTQKEAAYVLANMATCGMIENIKYLVAEDSIHAMGRMLGCSDTNIVILVLEFLTQILKIGEAHNVSEEYCTRMEEADLLGSIEDLQSHENEDVYNKALYIIETYFLEDNEEQATTNDGLYEFRNPLQEANSHLQFNF